MKYLISSFLILLIAAGCSKTTEQSTGNTSSTNNAQQTPANSGVVVPISRAKERVTKKPFGIYITPKTSPVQPERFTGYHSGVDFETFPDEQNTDVAVNAICNGKLASKGTVSGYGGLISQFCTIDGQAVKILYGHVRLSSVTEKVGDELKAGEQIAVLGTGYSKETDGERKHLHLGIIKGQGSSVKGYVQQKSELDQFLDIQKYLN